MRRRDALLLLLTSSKTRAAGRSFGEAFRFVRTTTEHGGLAVQHRGRTVFEDYFGRGHRDALPNTASVGKAFTSIACGILMQEHAKLFPEGLGTRAYAPALMPPQALRLNDPRKAQIRMGQLLTMTGGIRGNTPGFVHGRAVPVNPPGPDGWQAMHDRAAVAVDLWCDPGAGYSYATASVHLASMVVRHVSGMEMQQYLQKRVADPLGWEEWGFGYKRPEIDHTPGGGGIQLRTRDMLKFGRMLADEGRWKDRQIVPREYARACGRQSPWNPHAPYSLQFDINSAGLIPGVPEDAFWKQGSGGHCLYMVPSLDLVVWKLGGRTEQYEPGAPAASPAFRPAAEAGPAALRTLELVVRALQAG